MKEFIVVDIEGSAIAWEIAILDGKGQLVDEAFDAAHPDYTKNTLKRQLLQTILQNFFDFAKQKQVIFHFANHHN